MISSDKSLAYPHTLRDIVAEYAEKMANLTDVIAEVNSVIDRANNAVQVVGGATGEQLVKGVYISEKNGKQILLSSAWKALYFRLGMDRIFSAAEKKNFERIIANPPELSVENLTQVFGKHYENPRYFILKGLAEVFCRLDKFYRSHSNFGIGKKGLPKRIILSGFNSIYGYSRDSLRDMCNAMLMVTGQPCLTAEEEKIIRGKGRFSLDRLGLEVRQFANGNAHVYFDARALNVVNNALHEFYGDILPDDSGEPPTKKSASSEVSRDLQFYPTPKNVAKDIIASVGVYPGAYVLEPSCGDGAILDELRKVGVKSLGYEVHAGRAQIAKNKGHSVVVGNFLETIPSPEFDFVVMNPPFYGKHYVKHINHALKFLKKGGRLVTVLPASAYYDHKLLDGRWYDLPLGSFSDSGTNVNTGYLVMSA